MKDLSNIKVNDQITIKNIDDIVKTYLQSSIFTGIKLNHLRLLCSLKEGKKYKVVDVCKTCQSLKIKIGNFYSPIRFKYIDNIF